MKFYYRNMRFIERRAAIILVAANSARYWQNRYKNFELVNDKSILLVHLMKIDIVIGGNTRQGSVYNAMKNTKSDIVIIHAGTRHSIKQEMPNFNGVTIVVKTKDTIKITDDCMLLEKGVYKVKKNWSWLYKYKSYNIWGLKYNKRVFEKLNWRK